MIIYYYNSTIHILMKWNYWIAWVMVAVMDCYIEGNQYIEVDVSNQYKVEEDYRKIKLLDLAEYDKLLSFDQSSFNS